MADYIASQTSFGYKLTGDADYTVIAAVQSFSGPSFKVAAIETTALSDTVKKRRPGLADSGEMSFSLKFDPADTGHLAIKDMLETPVVCSWQTTFPTTPATTFTFDGFATGFDVTGGGPEELIKANVSIQITGTVTVATAS